MKKIRLYWKQLLALVIMVCFIFYIWGIDLQGVADQLRRVGWKVLFLLPITAASYFLATWAWQLCMRKGHKRPPPLWKLFIVRQLGETLTLINPTNIVAGEYSKVLLLKKYGHKAADMLTSVVLSRFLVIFSFLILLWVVICTQLFWFRGTMGPVLLVLFVMLPILLGTVAGFVFAPEKAPVLSSEKKQKRWLSWLISFRIQLAQVRTEIRQFARDCPGHLIGALFLSMLHWIVGTMEFYFILHMLDLPVTFSDALTLEIGVMIFKSLGGFVPAQVGVEEYGNKFMLSLIGIPGLEIWVTVSLLRRARQLAWIAISSLFIFLIANYKTWKFYLSRTSIHPQ